MSIGKPISEETRRGKSLKHLLLYGIKMMVRRDIGGAKSIEEHGSILARKFAHKTYAEIGNIAADEIDKQVKGVKSRQSRTIEQIERRCDVMNSALVVAESFKEKDPARAYKILHGQYVNFVNGNAENKPAENDILSQCPPA